MGNVGDFTTYVANNTINTTDSSTWGGTGNFQTFTVKVDDWGVQPVTLPAPVIESIPDIPVSALERLDHRLNRVRQRVAA